MSEKVTLATLDKGQAVIINRIDNIQKDVDAKHQQNRSSIHHHNNLIQTLINDVWKLKVKIASYSAVSGVVTAVAIHYVEKLMGK